MKLFEKFLYHLKVTLKERNISLQKFIDSVNRLLVKKTHQFPYNSSEKFNVKTVSQQHTRLLLSSNKKDTTAESSSFERLESSHNCSEEEQYRKQILKPFAPHNGPRITDLCQNDKAKIGELMKKLASEKEEKENLQRELKMKETDYETTIVNLQRENQGMLQETRDFQNEFKTSINLLKTVDVRSLIKNCVNMCLGFNF